MIPVITTAGVQIPFIVGGSIIFEQIFALPGMGLYLIQALTRRDYNVIVSINLVIVVAVLAGNLLVDLTYGWLDPRIKYN
jgi:peptide/nickel transport system permease protein